MTASVSLMSEEVTQCKCSQLSNKSWRGPRWERDDLQPGKWEPGCEHPEGSCDPGPGTQGGGVTRWAGVTGQWSHIGTQIGRQRQGRNTGNPRGDGLRNYGLWIREETGDTRRMWRKPDSVDKISFKRFDSCWGTNVKLFTNVCSKLTTEYYLANFLSRGLVTNEKIF